MYTLMIFSNEVTCEFDASSSAKAARETHTAKISAKVKEITFFIIQSVLSLVIY